MSTDMVLSSMIFAALSLVLAAIAAASFQAGARSLGYWLAGWSARCGVVCLAVLSLYDPTYAAESIAISALVAPLMLAGAYEHARRTPPTWIATVAFVGSATLFFCQRFGWAGAGQSVALVVDPTLALIAAATVHRIPGPAHHRFGDRALVIAFLAYAACEAIDPLVRMAGFPFEVLGANWALLGLPLLAVQAGLSVARWSESIQLGENRAHSQDERMRLLVASRDAVVVEYDERGTVTYLSGGFAQDEEGTATAPSVVGRNVLDFYGRREDSIIHRVIEERGFLTEEDIHEIERSIDRFEMPGQPVRHFAVSRSSYRTDEGALRVVSHAHDVTDQIARERALRETRDRLSRAERVSQIGSWEFRPNTMELYWSDQHFRILGLEPEPGPVATSTLTDRYHPEDAHLLDEAATLIFKEGVYHELTYRILRADDGEVRHLRAVGEVEKDEDGRVLRVTGATVDITEREALDAALRRGRRYLDALVDSNILCVCYADDDGHIGEANDAFLSLIGYAREDLPLDWQLLTPSEMLARDAEAIASIQETGTALPYEKALIARDGTEVPIQIACAQVEPNRALVIALDQTERKQNEASVAAQQRVLERTVSDRTRELMHSQRRLNEAERLATVGTLAAGVAHQINNPIGAILNSTEYGLLCAAEPNAAKIFEEVLQRNLIEAQRCARIVKSMLQFSRDEPTEKWPEDVARLVKHAVRAIGPYAADHDATVQVQLSEEALPARVSPIEIEQAIVNVLRNAIESGTVKTAITLRLQRRDKSAEIEVVDDGRGIPAEDLPRLFEPFYSTRTRDGGTGLGLSVAHGIIADHCGEIHVDSVVGEGTRVTIRLPLEEVHPEH